jgi:hypothetical protein
VGALQWEHSWSTRPTHTLLAAKASKGASAVLHPQQTGSRQAHLPDGCMVRVADSHRLTRTISLIANLRSTRVRPAGLVLGRSLPTRAFQSILLMSACWASDASVTPQAHSEPPCIMHAASAVPGPRPGPGGPSSILLFLFRPGLGRVGYAPHCALAGRQRCHAVK